MKRELSFCPVVEKMLQAKRNAAKGDVRPRNVVHADQCDFQAFFAGQVVWGAQATAIEKVDLVDMSDADHRKRRVDDDFCAGFFQCFAARCLGCGFAVFHESSGQSPIAELRFDGAATKQYLFAPGCHAANYQARVLIMNMTTGAADMSGQQISCRYNESDISAAAYTVANHDNSI